MALKKVLEEHMGFETLAITPEEPLKPTAANILMAIEKTLEGSKEGDQLFFFFSGHFNRLKCGDKKNHEMVPFSRFSLSSLSPTPSSFPSHNSFLPPMEPFSTLKLRLESNRTKKSFQLSSSTVVICQIYFAFFFNFTLQALLNYQIKAAEMDLKKRL